MGSIPTFGTRARTALAAGAVVACLPACGGTPARVALAPPETFALHWREVGHVRGRDELVYVVRRLTVGPAGWSIEGSVRNTSPRTVFFVGRPHFRGENEFGIVVRRSAALGDDEPPRVFADHADPPVPSFLRPGAAWTGSFGGRERLPAGRYVRVVFGRFWTVGPYLWRGYWITSHAVHLGAAS